MKTNKGILSDEELKERAGFWNKKQFRTWSKKELERTSTDMQKLLVAIKEFSMDEIETIVELSRLGFGSYCTKDPKYIIRTAYQKDLDYAISIAPKTFKGKQG